MILPFGPSTCERLAPASINISIIERSACKDVVSSPAISTFPNTAPATRKFAAALQSASRSISTALSLCPPLTLNTISEQSDQSPSDSRKSRPPSISLPILTPNFLRTSRVMNIYGMLLGSLTTKVVFFSANGRAIRRPVISWEPCLPLISTLPPPFNGPATVNGTRTALSDASHFTEHPTASNISRAPVSGRSSKVFSPVISTGPSCS